MRNHEKHKAIAIPVSFLDGKSTKFLTVRDRRHCEWTFVTGAEAVDLLYDDAEQGVCAYVWVGLSFG